MTLEFNEAVRRFSLALGERVGVRDKLVCPLCYLRCLLLKTISVSPRLCVELP